MFRTNLLKWLIVVATLVPFIWLSVVSSAPSGERTVTWTAGDSSPFIQSPLPGERVSEVKDGVGGKYVTIKNEPVYMAVFPPSDDFTSATVTVEFDPNEAFAVEIGGLTNVAAYAVISAPIADNIARLAVNFSLAERLPASTEFFIDLNCEAILFIVSSPFYLVTLF